MIKKVILVAVLAASFGSFVPAANAALVIREAPPPPREEFIPEPRRGHVWSGGHWEWRNRHYQWVGGSWVRERRGHHYSQPTWVESNGRWRMERGNWRRGDRDGDGIPNRHDNAPNNPNRY